MDAVFVVCGTLIVLVFAVAGMSKLRDPRATANSLKEFGVPQAIAGPAASLLPYAELLVAALLLVPRLAWLGAVAALLLLSCFTVAVVLSLLRGQRPSCNCFGQVRSAPITWHTALRDALLVGVAGGVLWAGEGRLEEGLLLQMWQLAGTGDTAFLGWSILGLLVALQLWMNVKLIGQQGRLLLKIDNLEHRINGGGPASVGTEFLPGRALPLGQPLPSFDAVTLAGLAVSAQDLVRDRRPLFMLFVGADCAPCKELVDDLVTWRSSNQPADKLVVITSGSRQANLEKLAPRLGMDVLLQSGFELNDLLGVIATPSAMRFDPDGRVASGLAVGHEPIMSLASLSVAPPVTVSGRLAPARA